MMQEHHSSSLCNKDKGWRMHAGRVCARGQRTGAAARESLQRDLRRAHVACVIRFSCGSASSFAHDVATHPYDNTKDVDGGRGGGGVVGPWVRTFKVISKQTRKMRTVPVASNQSPQTACLTFLNASPL